jgi:hypothetical protein
VENDVSNVTSILPAFIVHLVVLVEYAEVAIVHLFLLYPKRKS